MNEIYHTNTHMGKILKGGGMEVEKMTRKNPDGSFRLPAYTVGTFRMEWQQETPVFFGEAVNKLGQYEELGTLEEVREAIRIRRSYGK